MSTALAFLLGYLIGSPPFGLLLTRFAGGGDIRKVGSGNIGATNVLRSGRKWLAALTLLLDLLKGFAAVQIARALFVGEASGDYWTIGVAAAAGAVIGHCFPLFLKFRGGKGVATYGGVCFGLAWPLGIVYAVTWIGMLLLTRISSMGAIAAAVVMPFAAYLLGIEEAAWLFIFLSLLILFRHRENIRALRRGEEGLVTESDEQQSARSRSWSTADTMSDNDI